ncbi:MAG: hypothetical protein HY298_13740 [Verrucomicrobia bacterium]|nr:hypothetical protein [Verrucomicrobiota bacterium]
MGEAGETSQTAAKETLMRRQQYRDKLKQLAPPPRMDLIGSTFLFMNRRRLALWVFVVLAISGVILSWYKSEPRFQGRPLRVWLTEVRSGNPSAANVIRGLGTNSLPALLRMVQDKDPSWRQSWTRLRREWDKRQIRGTIEYAYPPGEECRVLAVSGFNALGPIAEPAIPELTQLLNGEDTAYYAASALAAIGPKAVPALVTGLRNSNAWVRSRTAMVISFAPWSITSSNASVLVGSLIDGLKDGDGNVRVFCAEALKKIDPEAAANGVAK